MQYISFHRARRRRKAVDSGEHSRTARGLCEGTETPRASDVIAEYAADGRYHFSTSDMRSALGVSAAATRLALGRLTKKGLIASPARGFYVILPPEHRRLGCLPADQFIPALMGRLKQPYYAALLSAAQYHGAAHHRPQTFQVALAGNRRPKLSPSTSTTISASA